jgi:hypothetical protein
MMRIQRLKLTGAASSRLCTAWRCVRAAQAAELERSAAEVEGFMSFNRDVDHDRAATREVLGGQRNLADGRTNWLGHQLGSGAAQIDEMLIAGATKDQMAAARGAVDEHLRHLREEHGLPLVEAGGVWVFDRRALGV